MDKICHVIKSDVRTVILLYKLQNGRYAVVIVVVDFVIMVYHFHDRIEKKGHLGGFVHSAVERTVVIQIIGKGRKCMIKRAVLVCTKYQRRCEIEYLSGKKIHIKVCKLCVFTVTRVIFKLKRNKVYIPRRKGHFFVVVHEISGAFCYVVKSIIDK